MRFFWALLILPVLLFRASAAEIRTLKGETISGEVVSVNEKEIVILKGEEKITLKTEDILTLSLAPAGSVNAKYSEVELNDGTQLRCARVEFKKDRVKLTLLEGQTLDLPMSALTYVYNEAHLPENQQQWKVKVLDRQKLRDLIVSKSDTGVVNALEGTIGDADDEGKTIAFTIPSGRKVDVPITRPIGYYWVRKPDPNQKSVVCRVTDTSNNLLLASAINLGTDGYEIETPSGAKIKYEKTKLVKLDFSRGKLSYLSQMTPSEVKHSSLDGEDTIQKPYRADQNLDGEKIKLGGISYDLGLSIHATTELEYKLDGEYREFKAILGIDDDVGGDDGPTVLKILGDGNELASFTISRKDKERTRAVNLNIKDVKRLRIVVTTGDLLDLGKHLTLAEARVSK